MSLRATLPDPYCGAMGVVVLAVVAVAWIAIAVAATVWALRSRRHAREDAAAAEAAVVDVTAATEVDLSDQVDVSDARRQLPTQREV